MPFFIEAASFYILTSSAEGFQFLYILTILIIFLVSHCDLICISLTTRDIEHLLMLVDHLCIFFGEVSSPLPIFEFGSLLFCC